MVKIIMTKGLPASGKTTWVKQQKAKRINKDDLRSMIDDGKWSGDNERRIVGVRNLLTSHFVKLGYDVIVDDTNFSTRHEAELRKIAERFGAEFEIKDFTDVSVDECIKRDRKRQNSVGEKVIRDMYNQYLRPKAESPVYDPSLPDCIICDIDGTLAIKGDRGIFEWSKVGVDSVNEPVADLVRRLHKKTSSPLIILFSGRDGSCRPETEQWLKENGIKYDDLYMRAPGDMRKDSIIKRELYDAHIRDKYNVRFVIDDRDQVVDMWRNELGLTCLQVAEGDF